MEDVIEPLHKLSHVHSMQVAKSSQLSISPPGLTGADPIGAEVEQKHVPLDYAVLVNDCKILFLGENHSNTPIRPHLAAHAKMLKDAGVTHLAIEASESGKATFESLNRGARVYLNEVDTGPSENMPWMIEEFAAQSIQIVPIDIDQSIESSKEEREARLTANILQVLDKTAGKVVVLIGSAHVGKSMGTELTACAERIADAGVTIRRVSFVGGHVKIPLDLTEAVAHVGLQAKTFMLDLRRCAHLSHYDGIRDYIIHLPVEHLTSENSKPLFRFELTSENSESLFTFEDRDTLTSISIEPSFELSYARSTQAFKPPRHASSMLRLAGLMKTDIKEKHLP
jgi:hypothetical protein